MPKKRKPPAMPEPRKAAPTLPEPTKTGLPPSVIDKPGWYCLIADAHIPYHDKLTLELAVAEAKRRKVVGVILNGDTIDSHHISRHDKDPTAPRYVEEIQAANQFLDWLKYKLPSTEHWFKIGNHEARLQKFVVEKAPELFGLEGIDLSSLLHLKNRGIDLVDDKQIIHLGSLAVLHGHEYPGSGGVNPARWLYLKARSVAIVGHFHRVSEHHSRNIKGKFEGAWSQGCCCALNPRYLPLNDWQNGVAFVEVYANGDFMVDNRQVIHDKLL